MLDETLLREAEAFANSQTMAELFKRLKEQAREQWATSKPEAKEAREHLYRMHEALELLEVALQSKQTYVSWAQNDPDFYPLHNDQRFQTLLSTYA